MVCATDPTERMAAHADIMLQMVAQGDAMPSCFGGGNYRSCRHGNCVFNYTKDYRLPNSKKPDGHNLKFKEDSCPDFRSEDDFQPSVESD